MGCVPANTQQDHAVSLVQKQAWWIDRDGKADLAAAVAADWQAYDGLKSFGYGADAVWIKLRLRASSTDSTRPWIVYVKPAFLDHITLYDPVAGITLHSGDFIAPDNEALASIFFTFDIPALQQERDIYIRVESTSSRPIQVGVEPLLMAQPQLRTQERLLFFILVISFIFAISALVNWWFTSETVMGFFVIKQTMATLWIFFLFGFARTEIGTWLPPGALTSMASVLVPWIVGSTYGFMAIFLKEYGPPRILLVICLVLAVLLGLLPLIQLVGLTRESLFIASVMAPAGIVFFLAIVLVSGGSHLQPSISRVYLVIYFVFYGLLNAISIFVNLGWIKPSSQLSYAYLVNMIMDGFMMFVLLHLRARAMQKVQQETNLRLLLIEEQTHFERQQHEEQMQLFSMLAHELKTPLASLRMWMDAGPLKREAMEQAIQDMNQVIERCVHTGQLTDQGLQPIVENVDAVFLTQSVVMTCRSPEQVHFIASHDTVPMRIDPQMMSIVLANLLDNACKYSLANAPIQVSLTAQEQHAQAGWLWRVSNQAGQAGLPDPNQVFEKYYRSPQARRKSGSGLGLFLVKGLLELMDGDIAYTNHGDQIVFTVWVPA